jgi:hypothetical protein
MSDLERLMEVSGRENIAQFTAAAERVLVLSQKQPSVYDPADPLANLRGSYFELVELLTQAQEKVQERKLRKQLQDTTMCLVINAISFHLNFFRPNFLGISNQKVFTKLVREITGLFRHKNADYGNAFRFWGIPGLVVRIGDKYFRLTRLSTKNYKRKVADEKLPDTALDLANYGIMLLMLLDEGRSLQLGK